MIVGAGPAGPALGNILRAASVDCLVLEAETRSFVEQRPRAGVIEEWAVRELQRRGLADGLLERAQPHSEREFRFDRQRYRFPYTELTGHHHFVHPRPLLVTDLVREYADVRGGQIRFGVRDVRPHDRVRAERQERLAAAGRPRSAEGRLLEKRVLDMHDYLVEPMVFGRLLLAGDAAHLTAPIAAKGMNLALHDAFLLGDALVAYLTEGDTGGLDGCSAACLARVWDYQEFSQRLSEVYLGKPSG